MTGKVHILYRCFDEVAAATRHLLLLDGGLQLLDSGFQLCTIAGRKRLQLRRRHEANQQNCKHALREEVETFLRAEVTCCETDSACSSRRIRLKQLKRVFRIRRDVAQQHGINDRTPCLKSPQVLSVRILN